MTAERGRNSLSRGEALIGDLLSNCLQESTRKQTCQPACMYICKNKEEDPVSPRVGGVGGTAERTGKPVT